MKPFLIATFMILWLGLGPANKAQAQISYGYSVPLDEGGTDSSGMMNSPGGYFPSNAGYSGMMSSMWGYTPGHYGYSGSMYPWGYSPWNSGSSRRSTTGSSSLSTVTSNRTWSNQWNGFGRGGDMFQPSMSMAPTGMNSMGMRRR
jgi:hypothetical protein